MHQPAMKRLETEMECTVFESFWCHRIECLCHPYIQGLLTLWLISSCLGCIKALPNGFYEMEEISEMHH